MLKHALKHTWDLSENSVLGWERHEKEIFDKTVTLCPFKN